MRRHKKLQNPCQGMLSGSCSTLESGTEVVLWRDLGRWQGSCLPIMLWDRVEFSNEISENPPVSTRAGSGLTLEECTGPLPLYPRSSPSARVLKQGELASPPHLDTTRICELNFTRIKRPIHIVWTSLRSLMVQLFTYACAFGQKKI